MVGVVVGVGVVVVVVVLAEKLHSHYPLHVYLTKQFFFISFVDAEK
jgi:hypothetical protein